MANYIRAYRQRAEGADAGKPGDPIEFVASTEGIARDGWIIDAGGWELNNYRNNPVFLWCHDYWGGRPPIGRCEVEVGEGELRCRVWFDQGDPFALDIERKYRTGFLNAVSVGWDTKATEPTDNPDVRGRITRQELLDISAVPVPGDPEALKRLQARGLADVGELLARLAAAPDDPTLDPAARSMSGETDWHGVAALMARLYRTDVGETDAERKRLHGRLSARYRRLGKEAPEFLALSELDALTGDEIRGLFLAGEDELFPELFEAAAGGSLSARTRGELAEVARLIAGILGRTTETAEPPQIAPPATTPAEEPDEMERSLRALYEAMAA